MKTKQKKEFNYTFFPIEDFSKDKFIRYIVANFQLYATYSIFIKISFDKQLIFKMSGDKIGLVIN